MAVVQDAYDIPDDIVTGLATGLYRRIGSIIRYATGPKKGQIVMHLKPIELKANEQVQSLSEKAIKFIQQHKKQVGIAAVGTIFIGAGMWGYNVWKKREPKVLKEFRAVLKLYIDAIRNGNMNVEIINNLMESLESLKMHKDYEKINIQLSAEDIEILVVRIYDYTIKLAKDNAMEIHEDDLNLNDNAIINLQSYLKIQKRIFENAA